MSIPLVFDGEKLQDSIAVATVIVSHEDCKFRSKSIAIHGNPVQDLLVKALLHIIRALARK